MKIKELKLLTRNFDAQIEFYAHTIGLDLLQRSHGEATFNMGKSRLTLLESNEFKPYHFAINIPCNQEEEALEWLKKRVEVLRYENSQIQDFEFWNARAIYFYDRDNNIVELIARKNLNNSSRESFNAKSLLEISEIGMPVIDIERAHNTLKQLINVKVFDGGFDRFCAMGDENGLFICIDKNVKDWFPTGDESESSEFEIRLEQDGMQYELEFVKGVIRSKGGS